MVRFLDDKGRGGELFLLATTNGDGPPVPIGITDPQTGEITVAGSAQKIATNSIEERQLNYYIQVFAQTAESLDLLPTTTDTLRFCAGQIFYRDGKVEEIRLRCKLEAPGRRTTLWETDVPPSVGKDNDTEIKLSKEDSKRSHFSVKVVQRKNDKLLLFLWDLRSNLPAEAPVSHKAGSASITITQPDYNFEPVPLPHRAISEAAPLTTLKGLGRNLVPAKYQETPDLDRKTSEIALEDAQKQLWRILEQELTEEVDQLSDGYWERHSEGTKTIYSIKGVQENDCRELWERVKKKLNATSGGPGLQATDPGIAANNYFDAKARKTVIETRLIFWPSQTLKYQDGFAKPGVHYRSNQSPGYVALLDRHGNKPFRAEGWLWLPRGKVREGYRLAGRAEYIFQEGVQAMASLETLLIAHHKEEIERIQESLRSTLPFPETVMAKEEMIQKLKADIRRAKDHLATLSSFDCLNPLKCVLYAFHNQREEWANEKLALPNGKVINTSPYRVIRLDPNELYILLNASGDMWRTLIWRRLQALASFERTTWTKSGRRVDTGDRFIHVLLDGYRTQEELGARENERGLWKVLRDGNAVPSDAFFAVLSPDFLDRCYSWERDANGKIVFGAQAAALKASKSKHLIESKAIRFEENRKSATYSDSKRLTVLSERERWTSERKLLATRIIEAKTINKKLVQSSGKKRRTKNAVGGNTQLRKIDGKQYEVCRGTSGKGYSVLGWIKVGGYTTKDSRSLTKSYKVFMSDLKYFIERLGFELQIPKKIRKTSKVLDYLSGHRRQVTEKLQLDILVPLNLEELLQSALNESRQTQRTATRPRRVTSSEPKVNALVELKKQLKAAGIRQSELADMLGVSRESVNRWFSPSSTKRIPNKRIQQILDILDFE